jgi:hypothetical protein
METEFQAGQDVYSVARLRVSDFDPFRAGWRLRPIIDPGYWALNILTPRGQVAAKLPMDRFTFLDVLGLLIEEAAMLAVDEVPQA